MPESRGLEDAAVVVARALTAAGYSLGTVQNGTGDEELLEGQTVQHWKPGQRDAGGQVVIYDCAQMVILLGDGTEALITVEAQPW